MKTLIPPRFQPAVRPSNRSASAPAGSRNLAPSLTSTTARNAVDTFDDRADDRATPVRATAPPAAAPSSAAGSLTLGNRLIDRAAPPPAPLNDRQTAALRFLIKRTMGMPPVGGFVDWRTADSARTAVARALVTAPDGRPASLGALTIFRVGGSNFAPSPAFLFRLAQHTDRLVLSYQNNGHPTLRPLRALDELEGVPVPDTLRGKIFAVGSDDPAVVPIDTASDGFVEQLQEMHRAREQLGLDVLQSRATVLSHSESTVDAPFTRKRLEAAGLDQVIGRIVAISSIAGMHRPIPFMQQLSDSMYAGVRVLGPAPDLRRVATDPLAGLGPRAVRALLRAGDERLIDLTVASAIGPAPAFGLHWFRGNQPVDPNNIRPQMRAAAAALGAIDALSGAPHLVADDHSDGVVPIDATRFGTARLMLTQPHDHAGIVEDAAVVDVIVGALVRTTG